MKAMILAAGLGTRLRPMTEEIPKCMMRIGGKPLLEHIVRWLQYCGVNEIIINIYHLPEAIRGYFGNGQKWGVRITYSMEDRLLGTAGGVKNVAWFFDEAFFVWYGDNFSVCDLNRLHAFHKAKSGLATIALYYRDEPTQSGIVALDENDRVIRFLEKPSPDKVFSRWVSAGIFVLEPAVLEVIPADGSPDFGRDIFPVLMETGKLLYGYRMSKNEGLWWIDTPEDLQQVIRKIGHKFK